MAKKKSKEVIKYAKKLNKVTLFLVLLFLVIGVVAGGATMHFLTKNDIFALIGESEITLQIGDEYLESGAVAVAFGKDISSFVERSGEVDTNHAGSYILEYKVDNIRFKNHVLYKLVHVVEEA